MITRMSHLSGVFRSRNHSPSPVLASGAASSGLASADTLCSSEIVGGSLEVDEQRNADSSSSSGSAPSSDNNNYQKPNGDRADFQSRQANNRQPDHLPSTTIQAGESLLPSCSNNHEVHFIVPSLCCLRLEPSPNSAVATRVASAP